MTAPQTSDSRCIRVFVMNDHLFFVEMLKRYLEDEPVLQVIGTALTATETIDQLARLKPDVVVIDPELDDLMNGDAVKQIRARAPTTGIVVLTLHDEPHHREVALAAGADEFIAKPAVADELVDAIQRADDRYHRASPSSAGTANTLQPSS